MQWVPVREIRSGMRLAKSILLSDGRLFLVRGSELRESYIAPLTEQGVLAVYVVNELAPDVVPEEVVSDGARRTLTEELRSVVRQLQPTLSESARRGLAKFSGSLDTDRLRPALGNVVDEVIANRQVVFNLKDLRNADDYTLGHSVNVCILSTLLGTVMGFAPGELRDMALGALMHDIGKTLTPAEILTKAGPLTPEEMTVMQQHTVDGWRILKEQRGIPYTSAIIALQHHERWEGGGYPEGLKGEQIYRYARVCTVADCFDAMTADRVYRPGMSSARALDLMQGDMAHFFEPDLVWNFTQCVAPYPVGSMVMVSGGLQGVVVGVRRGKTYRPRIRLVLDSDGHPLGQPKEIELEEHPHVQITGIIKEGSIELAPEVLAG